MDPILVILAIAAVVVAPLVAAFLLLSWIASGEPDANGDPERDAGSPWPADDDLQPGAQAWDRGSARAAGLSIQPKSNNL